MGEGSKELCRKDCNTSIENIILCIYMFVPMSAIFVMCLLIV